MLSETPNPGLMASQSSYLDMQEMARLRRQAQEDPRETLRAVARQFEGLMLQMMLKSMREASFGDELFDSSQSELYRDMFDKQITLNMTQGRGLGLADVMVRQMERYLPDAIPAERQNPSVAMAMERPIAAAASTLAYLDPPVNVTHQGPAIAAASGVNAQREEYDFSSPESFVASLWPLAQQTAEELGTRPDVIIAQAALETGWGQHMLNRPDGQSSFNLFNIKAGAAWRGETVAKRTLEYQDGVAVQELAQFRAYGSFAESFADYAEFLRGNPRYGEALQQAGRPERFAHALQAAGYATDPEYAQKIISIMRRNLLAAPQLAAAGHETHG
jgi:flagellar protein FlgJ